MPETINWGDVIFSLLTFTVLIAVIAAIVLLLVKFVFKNQKKEETYELNKKLDKIISLLEDNNDDLKK